VAHCIVLCSAHSLLHCTTLNCTTLHCTTLHCTALHCSALHCTALHHTALHCITLHCTTTLSHCVNQYDPACNITYDRSIVPCSYSSYSCDSSLFLYNSLPPKKSAIVLYAIHCPNCSYLSINTRTSYESISQGFVYRSSSPICCTYVSLR
jgi:hypothetical protein